MNVLKLFSQPTDRGISISWYVLSDSFRWNHILSCCLRAIYFVFLIQVFDTSDFVDSLYTWSAFNTEGVGKIVGAAIAELSYVVDVDGIHLIGKYSCGTEKTCTLNK